MNDPWSTYTKTVTHETPQRFGLGDAEFTLIELLQLLQAKIVSHEEMRVALGLSVEEGVA